MKKIIFITIALAVFNNIHAQKNITLNIAHKLGSNNFAFNTTVQNDLTQNFQITRVEYYISGIEIIHDNGQITPVNKYILANGSSNVSEALGNFDITNVEGIKFSIGVESPTNNADPTLQPPHSALAPKDPSMQWGWQSGYIFVAFDGKTGDGFSTIFELHPLGNLNYIQQTIIVPGMVNGNDIAINLDADYTQALKGINIASGPIKHGQDQEDLNMLKNFKNFVFKPGAGPTGIDNIAVDKNIIIYPNPSKGTIHVDFSKSKNSISQYKIMDMMGKVVKEGKMQSGNIIHTGSSVSGNYILVLYHNELPVFKQIVTVE